MEWNGSYTKAEIMNGHSGWSGPTGTVVGSPDQVYSWRPDHRKHTRGAMRKQLKNSLLLNLGVAMVMIISLSFIGMLSSVIIAETTEGHAAAINQAGTLRMQSYRIANSLYTGTLRDGHIVSHPGTRALIGEFNQRLNSPRLTQILSRSGDDEVSALYFHITDLWSRHIMPVLNEYLRVRADDPGQPDLHRTRDRYLNLVDAFVANIDQLVRLLEEKTEAKIQLLRLIQIVILFATIAVVSVTMYIVQTRVLSPLRELLVCAEHAHSGDFSIRTRYTGDDELGRLGHAFNLMAENLSRIYGDLERRVRLKTRDLERSNRSLELLYRTTHQLSIKPASAATFNALLHDISQMLGLGKGSICLSGDDHRSPDRTAFQLASTHELLAEGPDLCNPPDCQRCFNEGRSHTIHIDDPEQGELRVFSSPIHDREHQYGVLLMEIPDGTRLQPWQERLLEAVAQHIGIALNLAQRSTQERRLALLEERNVIARELHDSLAQSLSYMKIQVSRLDAALGQAGDEDAGRTIINELRQGLNSAYRELRELLTTFRLRIEGRGLNLALSETVKEFRQRSDIDINVDFNLSVGELSANEEINVLQIIREALSNVLQHARATEASVRLRHDALGHVIVQIDDNGIGLRDRQRPHHYGTTIMQERARSLGGSIRYLNRPSGGTRVELIFEPSVQNTGNPDQESST